MVVVVVAAAVAVAAVVQLTEAELQCAFTAFYVEKITVSCVC